MSEELEARVRQLEDTVRLLVGLLFVADMYSDTTLRLLLDTLEGKA